LPRFVGDDRRDSRIQTMEAVPMHVPATTLTSRRRLTPGLGPRRAFTLIEVLVVVAILALLIAILVPSLSKARIQAKLASDKANCKQIATMMAIYQAEEQGYVPIMLNWHAGPPCNAPARAVFLSVALRRGEKGLAALSRSTAADGTTFDPNSVWNQAKRDEYEARFLPEHYVCPFERGREPWDLQQVGSGPAGLEQWEWRGVMESYQTWMWEDVVRGEPVHEEPVHWGGNPANGLPKYSVLTWNQITATGKSPTDADIHNKLHRRWTDKDGRRIKGSGLGDVTVIYCAIGEHMEMGNRRIDVGSHATGAGGGTNAIFGDTHVEWVRGPQIGWP
jgi:prepilin-type N-terminal cleavage/methylation domain-containing protein